MKRNRVLGCRLAIIMALFAALAIPAMGRATSAKEVPGQRALDYAFRFASAITPDPKDMAKAQAAVVGDYAHLGRLEQAAFAAMQIQGWRKGVALADLAKAEALRGRNEEAGKLLRSAEEVEAATAGWQKPRIRSHIAGALAAMGELDRSRQMISSLEQADRAYAGQTASTVSSGFVAEGRYDEAMESLKKESDEKDAYVAWRRTAGFVAIASNDKAGRSRRLEALSEAKVSAKAIPGWKQASALQSIAAAYLGLGKRKEAVKALDQAGEIMKALPETVTLRAALLSNLARSWIELGEGKKARRLLVLAEPMVAGAMVIEQPGLYGNLAVSYSMLEDKAEASRLLEVALGSAGDLKNSRPRALALVTICRTFGRHGLDLDEGHRADLDRLFESLGDPW